VTCRTWCPTLAGRDVVSPSKGIARAQRPRASVSRLRQPRRAWLVCDAVARCVAPFPRLDIGWLARHRRSQSLRDGSRQRDGGPLRTGGRLTGRACGRATCSRRDQRRKQIGSGGAASGVARHSPQSFGPAGYRRDTRLSLESSKATTSSAAQWPEDPIFRAVEPEPTTGLSGESSLLGAAISHALASSPRRRRRYNSRASRMISTA
jgi:hypothetical protein